MAKSSTYTLDVLLGAKVSSSFNSALHSVSNSLSSLGGITDSVVGLIGSAFSSLDIAGNIREAVEVYSDFEQEMATVRAISQASQYEFESMKEAALDAGASTVFTATESAKALEYMSLAGWDVNTSVAALNPLLQLAAATGADLKTTSDLVTDSMTSLGVGVKDMSGYLDMVAQANNSSNTTAEQLMQALVKTGGSAKTLGVSLDDTITSLGILANNGFKAEEAGTSLNSILVRLASNSTALKQLNALDLSLFDEKGNFKGWEQSLKAIYAKTSKMTNEQRTQVFANIAGSRQYSRFAYLVDAMAEDAETGITAWQGLNDKINSSAGALGNMYDVTTDTYLNAQKRWESATQDMQIRLVDVFGDSAKEFVGWAADNLPRVTKALTELASTYRGDFAKGVKQAEKTIEGVWDAIVNGASWLVKNKSAIIGTITGIATTLATWKAAEVGVKSLLYAFEMLSNPMVATVGAIGLTVGAITGLTIAIAEYDQEMKQAAIDNSLADHFGDLALSISDAEALARAITGDLTVGLSSAMTKAADEAQSSLDALQGVQDALSKEQWIFDTGIEFSEEDSQRFASEVQNFISRTEKYLMDNGYSVHIAASFLFGQGSQQDIDVSKVYAGFDNQMSELSRELSEQMENSMKDGILSVDENAIVQTYLDKMNRITNAIAQAQNASNLDALAFKYSGAKLDSESFSLVLEDVAKYQQDVVDAASQAVSSYMAPFEAQYALGDISKAELEGKKSEAWEAAYKQQGDAIAKGVEFMMNTLHDTYPESIDMAKSYNAQMLEALSQLDPSYYKNSNASSSDPFSFDYLYNGGNATAEASFAEAADYLLDNGFGDIGAMQSTLEQMRPTMELLQQTVDAMNALGKEAPQEYVQALNEWNEALSMATTDRGEVIRNLKEYYESIQGDIEGEINSDNLLGLDEGNVTAKAEEALDKTKELTQQTFDQGLEAEATVTVNPTVELDENNLRSQAESKLNEAFRGPLRVNSFSAFGSNDIKHYASGGIITNPTLATFAETSPEAAIPLDGSARAKSLWTKAGEMLGMLGGNSRDERLYQGISSGSAAAGGGNPGNIQVNFSPNVSINGSANEGSVREALKMSMEDFREMFMDVYRDMQYENSRVSYS